MSYDLLFWRGPTTDSPAAVITKFSRSQAVDGVEALDRTEVVEAFRSVFGEDLEIDKESDGRCTAIHGWLFSVELRGTIDYLWVTCNWKVTQHREVLEKLIAVGYERLGCHAYNPQIDEFAANEAGG